MREISVSKWEIEERLFEKGMRINGAGVYLAKREQKKKEKIAKKEYLQFYNIN